MPGMETMEYFVTGILNSKLCALISSKNVRCADLISLAKFSFKIHDWNNVVCIMCILEPRFFFRSVETFIH